MKLSDLQLRFAALTVAATCGALSLIDVRARNLELGYSVLPFGLSGTFPSFATTFAGPLFALAIVGSKILDQYARICLLVICGMAVHELMQIWMPQNTFDWWDIAALIAGAVASLLFVRLLTPLEVPRELRTDASRSLDKTADT